MRFVVYGYHQLIGFRYDIAHRFAYSPFSKIQSIAVSSKPAHAITGGDEGKCLNDHLRQKCSSSAANFSQRYTCLHGKWHYHLATGIHVFMPDLIHIATGVLEFMPDSTEPFH